MSRGIELSREKKGAPFYPDTFRKRRHTVTANEKIEDKLASRASLVSRRDFLRLSGAGIAGVALLGAAGCGGGGGEQQGNGGGNGGNSIVVGYEQEPTILNQFITGGDSVGTSDSTAGILESPLVIQPDFTYAPQLADGDPEIVSEDPLTIQYRLKEGITFSDGEPLTSEDAKFTYEQIMNPDNQIVTREGWEKIERFETPDERTVRMVFSEPYASWRDLLGGSTSVILPQHVYEGKDFNTALNDEVVGSGPYVFGEWRKGESLTVERNEGYWGEKAALDAVTYRFITDTNSLIAALQSGEVQFINPSQDVGLTERLEAIQGTKLETKAGANWSHMSLNVEKLDNPKIRQAIAYGIDRRQIVEELLQGQVNPLQSVIVPELEDYYVPAWEQYAYDPDRARQLVEEARSEGAATDITYSTSAGVKLNETLQQIIQQQLRDVGINIEITNSDPTSLLGQAIPNGDFEIVTFGWSTTPEPAISDLFSGNQLPPDGQNYVLYQNEEVTRLLEESDRTIEVPERARLLKQAQEQIAADVPIIPLYQAPEPYAFVENLQGPQVNPTLAGPFWNLGEWSLNG